MKLIIKSIFILIMTSLMSCEKDDFSESRTIDIPDPIIQVQKTSLVVYVKDNWGPQPRAFITLNGQTIETDEAGRAFFKLNSVGTKGDLVHIEADNRIPINKRILIQPGKKNILNVYLEVFSKRTGYSTDEESVFIGSGVTMRIPANSLEYKDGSGAYSGTFGIWNKFYNADEEALETKMPGDLLTKNSDNELNRLKNYGMFKVELLASDGRLLDIIEGQKVRIAFTIPEEMELDAPDVASTFWMNEDTGLWVEEGSAVKEEVSLIGITNYIYTFEVEHFTWWGCHLYSCINEVVTISGTLLTEEGGICGGCQLEIIGVDASTTVTTNSDGTFGVLSCPNENYDLIGYYEGLNCDSNDGQPLGSYSSGSEDTDWGEITIDDPDIIAISGTIYNCDGETEEGSYVMINESIIIETTENGQFEFLACYQPNTTITLEGFNELGTLMSETLILELDPQGHAGLILNACLESDVYLDIYRDGELVQHIGRIAQDKICDNANKICISVGKEYFDDEYFSVVMEFIEIVNLQQIVTYTDLEVTPQSTTLYSEDVHNNINNWIGKLTTIDILEVKEYDEYKTVFMKFQAVGGPDAFEMNYEIEFRIKV